MKARTHTTTQLLRMNDIVLKKIVNLKTCIVVKLTKYMACGRAVSQRPLKTPTVFIPRGRRNLHVQQKYNSVHRGFMHELQISYACMLSRV